MPRIQSQIPRLKPASSCGNLVQLAAKNDAQRSHHGSRSNLNMHNASGSERTSMINAPTPVTHRRMYHNHNLSRPPWAIDDTISPFDREPENNKKSKNNNRIAHSERGGSTNNILQSIAIRVESPSVSLDYMRDSFPRDEYDGLQSPFGNGSSYKSDNPKAISPQKQVGSCQTDLTGIDWNFIPTQNNKGFQTIPPQLSKTEKKLVLPLRELKRTSQKNNLTYKINNKSSSVRDPIDFNKVFNVQDRLANKSDEDVQSRIDYWLNKNISLDQGVSDKSSHSSFRNSPVSPASNKPIFRNQITFTPRPVSSTFPENGNFQNLNSYSSSPQIIEAVIFQSDSESDKDYIVSSRSMESKLSRPNSHFTIRANLASKSRSLTSEISNSTCEVCGQQLMEEDQMSYSEIKCHRNCFKCFWCKKKLSIDNYKVNTNKLCCPLHYRLLSN